ncbi:hypothetical protein ACO1O0_007032 [Amphichorda felina]
MSRFSRYDTDEDRLPDGMTRVGYDADTQVYTFQDSDGSLWEGAPGCQYGQLTRVGDAPDPEDDNDTAPFLVSEQLHHQTSWRAELMPLLNFGLLIGLCLLLLFWYLHVAGSSSDGDEETVPGLSCPDSNAPYTIQKGDSCWVLADERSITVDEVVSLNPGLNCEKLMPGFDICLPQLPAPV